jgi:hypothetical protein
MRKSSHFMPNRSVSDPELNERLENDSTKIFAGISKWIAFQTP